MKRHVNDYQLVDEVKKDAFVWHAKHWRHSKDFHSHRKAQLVFVEDGFQYLNTQEKSFLLPKNHAAWIPSSTPHKTSSPLESVSLRTIYYEPKVLSAYFDDIYLFYVPEVLKKMILYTEKWSMNTKQSISEEYFLKAILYELPQFITSSVPLLIPSPKSEVLKNIAQFLQQNYDQKINIGDLSNIFHIGRRTLERNFKSEMDMTISKYIQLIRLVKSVELLNQREYNISEIAFQVGYKSVQSFSNSFFHLLGKRPQFYRSLSETSS